MKHELIDIHAHINFNAFESDGDEVIKRTLEGSVGIILVGSQFSTSNRAVEYARRHKEGVWSAVGLHPIHLVEINVDSSEIGGGAPGFKTRVEEFDYIKYKELGQNACTVAVGECGFDYYRPKLTDEVKKKQDEVFRMQIALAREIKKPLIIHCRNAYDELLKVLINEKAHEIGGDIHFFAGSWGVAKKFLDLGFHLSFTGVITFTSDYDEVVKKAPMDRIMVETDSPYVSPVPHRGKRNEPLYVKEIARRVAEIRGVDYEKISHATTENAIRLFNLQ